MVRCFVIVLLLAGLVVSSPRIGFTAVEKNIVKTLSVPGGPVDSAVSGDGNLFFVLTVFSCDAVFGSGFRNDAALDAEANSMATIFVAQADSPMPSMNWLSIWKIIT